MTSREHSGSGLGPEAQLRRIEGDGQLLSNESAEYFKVGYRGTDAVFDPSRSTLDNVTAVLHARASRGDGFAPNQGGFVLGVLARVEELSRGQQQ
jgi:hypothetical protein